MKIVSAAEMREIDLVTSRQYGVPSLTLMENAGAAVARFALQQFPEAKRVIVVCGKGNNGGDGFVAARKLREGNVNVRVLLLARPEEVKGDAHEMLDRLGFDPEVLISPDEVADETFGDSDLILDAIFGTGFRHPLPALAQAVIRKIRESRISVLSVDIPSGADSDSFTLKQDHSCPSDAIVTFTAPKPGIVFSELTRGPIVVAEIGSPEASIKSDLNLRINQVPDALHQARPLNSNKGLYGHVLVIGGSLGKSGAPTMSSLAALRAGAGLVTCAIPRSVLPTVAGAVPELMTEPLDENAAGAISERALDEPESGKLLERKNVVALGPGLGRDPETVTAIRKFVANCPAPLVLDADALNAFERGNELLDGSRRPLVLTPHPGEMARLLGTSVREIEADRIGVARNFAREHNVVLVLKGWRTLIADARGIVLVNTTGNPGLSKGGSGDVLTGIIAGLVAQYPARVLEATCAAVYLHGLAADLAVRGRSERTLLATDVIAALSQAFRFHPVQDGFTWLQLGSTEA